MELSAKVEYALLSLVEMASQPNLAEPMQIKEIASRQGIPDRYLEQVFSSLRRAGIVQSQRGSKGGYTLAHDPWQITVLDVFNCLEESKHGKNRYNQRKQCCSNVRSEIYVSSASIVNS